MDYKAEEVTQLAEKIRNGLGCWLTFVTELEMDSPNNKSHDCDEAVSLRSNSGASGSGRF